MTPDEHTNREFFLDVGGNHELYVHDWGNPHAKTPIINLHGGPGSGTRESHKNYYDPARQRVIFFDQRGCGRSLPYGSLNSNTTQHLIHDITLIAKELKLPPFVLRGGSWGSCLALAYALYAPKHVKALVLDGVFTGTAHEINWLNEGIFRTFYPEVWHAFVEKTPKAYHRDPATYHINRALGNNESAAKASAHAYAMMEWALMRLDDRTKEEPLDDFDPTSIKTELHYLANKCFLADRYIVDNAHRLTMPVYLIQGRYDMVCPPSTTYALHGRIPQSELIWTISGHHGEHEAWNLIRTVLHELTK